MTLNSIAILGHRSWVGQKVVPALAETGCPLKVIVRSGSSVGDVPKGVEVVQLDWTDEGAFVSALQGVNIVLSLVGQPGLASQATLPPILAKAGIDLFIPSDFTFEHSAPEAKEIPVMKNKAILESKLEEAGVGYMKVWQGNFAEFALGTPRVGVDIAGHRVLVTGNNENERLTLCTREYVAAALASLLPFTPPSILSGRTIGLSELRPTMSEIRSSIQARQPSQPVSVAREPDSAALERIADGHPLALMDLVKILWSRGEHSVGEDIYEVPGYKKATLDELVLEDGLGTYREVAVPYTLDQYFL